MSLGLTPAMLHTHPPPRWVTGSMRLSAFLCLVGTSTEMGLFTPFHWWAQLPAGIHPGKPLRAARVKMKSLFTQGDN